MRKLAMVLLGLWISQAKATSPLQNTVSISPSDFLELERTKCFGSCPSYTVRIQADGQVTWKGADYVKVPGQATAKVSAEQARALIEKAIANNFWDLNAVYTAPVTDNPTYYTTLHVGSREKRVSNYYRMAPDWVNKLEGEIDSLANSDRWINGEAAGEIFTFLARRDLPVPPAGAPLVITVTRPRAGKSGATPLMIASLEGNLEEVKRLLAAKADPNAQDGSGWTPLIYAMFSRDGGEAVIPALLSAGANPKMQSFMGQTAAMAAVMSFYTPLQRLRLLVDAGADLNTQDKNGQTALMFAANSLMAIGNDTNSRYMDIAEMVTFMRGSGARTDLRDGIGLSVQDYILQIAQARPGYRTEYLKVKAILEGVTPGVHPPVGVGGRVIRPADTLEGYRATTVVLERVGNGVPAARATLSADGTFQFNAVPTGIYTASLLPFVSMTPPLIVAVSEKAVNGLEIQAPAAREVIIHPTVEGGGIVPAFGLVVVTALPGQKIGAPPRFQADTIRPFPSNLLPFVQENAGAMLMQIVRIGGTAQDETQMRFFLPSPWSNTPVLVSEPLPGGDFRITLPEGEYVFGAVVPMVGGRGLGNRNAYSVTSITRDSANIMTGGVKIQGTGSVKIGVAFKQN